MYRAGADRVTGAEIGQHMCDVAAEAVVMNGYAAKCLMINKDVRRIDVAAKADGTPPDMEQKANLCMFEVRTCVHMHECQQPGFKLLMALVVITTGLADPRLYSRCVCSHTVEPLT